MVAARLPTTQVLAICLSTHLGTPSRLLPPACMSQVRRFSPTRKTLAAPLAVLMTASAAHVVNAAPRSEKCTSEDSRKLGSRLIQRACCSIRRGWTAKGVVRG